MLAFKSFDRDCTRFQDKISVSTCRRCNIIMNIKELFQHQFSNTVNTFLEGNHSSVIQRLCFSNKGLYVLQFLFPHKHRHYISVFVLENLKNIARCSWWPPAIVRMVGLTPMQAKNCVCVCSAPCGCLETRPLSNLLSHKSVLNKFRKQ